MAFSGIPVEMREELVAGVKYIQSLPNRAHNLDPIMVEVFGEKLAEILCHKYNGHWHPEKPMKGQEYRLGEEGYPHIVASFDPSDVRILVGGCEETKTPPIPGSPTEGNIWWVPTLEPMTRTPSTAIFRTPSPLWIPAWRANQFSYVMQMCPKQAFWL